MVIRLVLVLKIALLFSAAKLGGLASIAALADDWQSVRRAAVTDSTGNNSQLSQYAQAEAATSGGLRWLAPGGGILGRKVGEQHDRKETKENGEFSSGFAAVHAEESESQATVDRGAESEPQATVDRAAAAAFEVPIDVVAAPEDDPLSDPFGDRINRGDLEGPNKTSIGRAPLPRPLPGPAELVPPPAPIADVAQSPGAETKRGVVPPPGPTPLPGELLEAIPQGPTDERPMEEQLAQVPGIAADECPPADRLRDIKEILDHLAPKPGKFPVECPLPGGNFEERRWRPVVFTWTASALCHKPLYFEQVAVERYGHNLGPIIQPFASATHFFLTIPILPYKMGLNPPNECIYPLGYYRPGSCAPWILDPFPLSVRAALAEGGYWTALAFAIP